MRTPSSRAHKKKNKQAKSINTTMLFSSCLWLAKDFTVSSRSGIGPIHLALDHPCWSWSHSIGMPPVFLVIQPYPKCPRRIVFQSQVSADLLYIRLSQFTIEVMQMALNNIPNPWFAWRCELTLSRLYISVYKKSIFCMLHMAQSPSPAGENTTRVPTL